MNRELALQVANAVLYEGYMLYPYRPSAIKNRQRWTFGILYPPDYDEVRRGTERSQMHTECLFTGTRNPTIHIEVRFLQLVAREVANVVNERVQPAQSIIVDGNVIEGWEEGMERSLEVDVASMEAAQPSFPFHFSGNMERELVRDGGSEVVAEITRTRDELQGTVSVSCQCVREGVWKLTLEIANTTPLPSYAIDRDSSLLRSLISAHAILTIRDGEFVSLLDPPPELREQTSGCRNIGNFPVLVGAAGQRDMVLCSPIVLYDYPQVAPESAGDFYDATEIDEMLTLRVMTLTEEEKNEMRMADPRVRELLQRTEQSAREQLTRTHGTFRSAQG